MYQITQKIRHAVRRYKVDTASKAGVLKIFEHTGGLKAPKDLRSLSEKERSWFKSGFEEYLADSNHPARDTHALIYYGQAVYYLSLVYYFSLIIWIVDTFNTSIKSSVSLNWLSIWEWIFCALVLNTIITFYGIYLENKAYKRQLFTSQRWLAGLIVLVLAVAVIGNLISPYLGIDKLSLFVK